MQAEKWIISMGDGGGFEVRRATERDYGFAGDGVANGDYPTKAAALQALVDAANQNVAVYRAMRRRAKRALRR